MYIRKPLHWQLFALRIFHQKENNFEQAIWVCDKKNQPSSWIKKLQRLIYNDFF